MQTRFDLETILSFSVFPFVLQKYFKRLQKYFPSTPRPIFPRIILKIFANPACFFISPWIFKRLHEDYVNYNFNR